jgi:pyruvate dehydrogenase E1 component
MPKDAEAGIIKGMYLFTRGEKAKLTVQLLGSGAILNEVIAASALLKQDFNVSADVWSVTSFSELRRDGDAILRENRLHPTKSPAMPYVETCLKAHAGPIIAATDYVRAVPDLIRPYLARTYITLGTDGFGRSDTRENLRRFFEVDRYYIVVAALYALLQEDQVSASEVEAAIKKYGIDPEKPNPLTI